MAIALSGSDGHLLTHYFTATNPTGFTDAQQVAVSGYKASVGADIKRAWYDAANQSGRTDPVPGAARYGGLRVGAMVRGRPGGLRYDPATNRTGLAPPSTTSGVTSSGSTGARDLRGDPSITSACNTGWPR